MENNNHKIQNIILVEDDIDDQKFFAQALSEVDADIELSILDDGLKLWHLFDGKNLFIPDLIVLDLNLPLMNGLECLHQIKTNPLLTELKIVIHSTGTGPTQIDTAYELGANLYIPKRSDFSEFKIMLRKLLSLHWEKYIPKPKPEDFVWGRKLIPRIHHVDAVI